jgi:hypothetical protein
MSFLSVEIAYKQVNKPKKGTKITALDFVDPDRLSMSWSCKSERKGMKKTGDHQQTD